MVLVDRDGKIADRKVGFTPEDMEKLQKTIERILAE
jgi:hypothetical protein